MEITLPDDDGYRKPTYQSNGKQLRVDFRIETEVDEIVASFKS